MKNTNFYCLSFSSIPLHNGRERKHFQFRVASNNWHMLFSKVKSNAFLRRVLSASLAELKCFNCSSRSHTNNRWSANTVTRRLHFNKPPATNISSLMNHTSACNFIYTRPGWWPREIKRCYHLGKPPPISRVHNLGKDTTILAVPRERRLASALTTESNLLKVFRGRHNKSFKI